MLLVTDIESFQIFKLTDPFNCRNRHDDGLWAVLTGAEAPGYVNQQEDSDGIGNDAQSLGKYDWLETEEHPGGNEYGPQEIGVGFNSLTGVVYQAQSVGKIPGVTKRDESIVAAPGQANGPVQTICKGNNQQPPDYVLNEIARSRTAG